MNETTQLHERIISRRSGPLSDDDPDAYDDCGTFGFLRGVKERALMLDFRLKNGNRVGLPYALLERVAFDPSEGLTLQYYGVEVEIRGRNLARPAAAGVSLLEGIYRHRVPWIGEVEELHGILKPEGAVVVTQIDITILK